MQWLKSTNMTPELCTQLTWIFTWVKCKKSKYSYEVYVPVQLKATCSYNKWNHCLGNHYQYLIVYILWLPIEIPDMSACTKIAFLFFRYLPLTILFITLLQGFKALNTMNITQLVDINSHINTNPMSKLDDPVIWTTLHWNQYYLKNYIIY